jgi:hypothetical protein
MFDSHPALKEGRAMKTYMLEWEDGTISHAMGEGISDAFTRSGHKVIDLERLKSFRRVEWEDGLGFWQGLPGDPCSRERYGPKQWSELRRVAKFPLPTTPHWVDTLSNLLEKLS